MDPDKVGAVNDCEPPEYTFDVRSLVSVVNVYRRFIKSFSDIVRLLTALTWKGVKSSWSDECQQAFNKLKITNTTTSILAHFDWDKKIFVETNISNLNSADVLSPYDNDGILYLVVFYSKKHSLVIANCKKYHKELMAIVQAFERWGVELSSSEHPV